MTNPQKKRLTLYLQWCLDNESTLSLESFALKFRLVDKRQANQRFKDILCSNSFESHQSVKYLIQQFDSWKGSKLETSFRTKRALDETKKQTCNKITSGWICTFPYKHHRSYEEHDCSMISLCPPTSTLSLIQKKRGLRKNRSKIFFEKTWIIMKMNNLTITMMTQNQTCL